MKQATEILAPFRATAISIQPFGPGFWSFNPSILREPDTGRWLCAQRHADYCAPNGIVRANMAKGGRVQTFNTVAVLEPQGAGDWRMVELYELPEIDGLPRNPLASSQGFEDLRLYWTERDGVCAIATTMQLRAEQAQEMVALRFADPREGDWSIISATPLRGAWSTVPQKNWMPYVGTMGPRFLYSIERGIVFDEHGPIWNAPHSDAVPEPITERAQTRTITYSGGVETRLTGKVVRAERADGTRRAKPEPPRSDWSSPGLRGGSQLVPHPFADGLYLGIGHDMIWRRNVGKHYWHVLFTCDGAGHVITRSEPFKLSECGIEFAAGLAIDDATDDVIISYGTEDRNSWLATTPLEIVLDAMKPADTFGKAAAR